MLQSEQALVESSYLLGKRLAESGMIYAEIRFASQQHCQKGLSQKQAVQAVCYGIKQVEKYHKNYVNKRKQQTKLSKKKNTK